MYKKILCKSEALIIRWREKVDHYLSIRIRYYMFYIGMIFKLFLNNKKKMYAIPRLFCFKAYTYTQEYRLYIYIQYTYLPAAYHID